MLHFADIFTNDYIIENVPADGNCMSTSLAIGLSLNRTASSAQDIRNEIVQFIREHETGVE